MFRKGSAALVLNNKNEILLVNLESFEEKYFTVVGGGQEHGETLLDTAYREIKEELNISNKDLEFIGACKRPVIFNFVKPTTRDGVEYIGSEKFYFGFKFIGDKKSIIPSKGEVRSYRWVKYKDLKNYLLFGSQLLDTQIKIEELFPFITKTNI